MDEDSEVGYRILILEDEFIIADTLTRHLERNGHRVVGQAISYDEAVELYRRQKPDLALLDIRVSGTKTGVDFAHFLRAQQPVVPFVFLTSQMDASYTEQVKQTLPGGYLGKPIQIKSLLGTIEVAMYNHRSRQLRSDKIVTLRDGRSTHRISVNSITYVEADHVYVRVHCADGSSLVIRNTLSDLISQVGEEHLLQTHRSFAVNPHKITSYEKDHVCVGDREIPVSRGRRQRVAERL